MKPSSPPDELLERYAQANAQLPDSLPAEPPAALHERIMHAAREQAKTINSVALSADSVKAESLKHHQNTISTTEAANDSVWSIKAIASIAVMGLSALLWWQFEQGSPQEQEAAKSALPSAVIAAAPAPRAAQAPAAAAAAPAETSARDMPSIATEPPAPKPASARANNKEEKKIANAEIEATTGKVAAAPITSTRQKEARARPAEVAAPAPAPAIAQQSPADKPLADSQPARKTAPIIAADASLQRSLESSPASNASTASLPAPAAAARAAAPRAAAPAPPALAIAPSTLFSAILAKDAAALRQALAQGASPNARNPEGNPALTQAVIQRWSEGVRILLAAGANKEAKNSKGHTAADVAQGLGDREILELLSASRSQG